uniref:Uncharacterized protein n=1 Tax=Tetraselmis sp. GSL018 TaxID=582737 RepID=A0A061R1E2_9CHLO|mmetsp:Transcript_26986/g.64016  ORF Transcript_26986/g.64016 Transcript_26986/m.64016 type:complete len:386 (+) Transcript_26986:123-1280(+)|eukprot:CAMPEP_0177599388 /NCGR_PEP_ID=MMETSP0419_2-20121207/12957_1 /TAXON_ID=582737 /ORGANISM="Tetraselmis sp., Strain GSL018" /LENGTH=385 /DNA_ID=CAMNT_0019092099 /DNA_START=183 /DNA_END=1340 /DNA_ORIENTATION=+
MASAYPAKETSEPEGRACFDQAFNNHTVDFAPNLLPAVDNWLDSMKMPWPSTCEPQQISWPSVPESTSSMEFGMLSSAEQQGNFASLQHLTTRTEDPFLPDVTVSGEWMQNFPGHAECPQPGLDYLQSIGLLQNEDLHTPCQAYSTGSFQNVDCAPINDCTSFSAWKNQIDYMAFPVSNYAQSGAIHNQGAGQANPTLSPQLPASDGLPVVPAQQDGCAQQQISLLNLPDDLWLLPQPETSTTCSQGTPKSDLAHICSFDRDLGSIQGRGGLLGNNTVRRSSQQDTSYFTADGRSPGSAAISPTTGKALKYGPGYLGKVAVLPAAVQALFADITSENPKKPWNPRRPSPENGTSGQAQGDLRGPICSIPPGKTRHSRNKRVKQGQ